MATIEAGIKHDSKAANYRRKMGDRDSSKLDCVSSFSNASSEGRARLTESQCPLPAQGDIQGLHGGGSAAMSCTRF